MQYFFLAYEGNDCVAGHPKPLQLPQHPPQLVVDVRDRSVVPAPRFKGEIVWEGEVDPPQFAGGVVFMDVTECPERVGVIVPGHRGHPGGGVGGGRGVNFVQWIQL